jgi:hypothetical protein
MSQVMSFIIFWDTMLYTVWKMTSWMKPVPQSSEQMEAVGSHLPNYTGSYPKTS